MAGTKRTDPPSTAATVLWDHIEERLAIFSIAPQMTKGAIQ
jgi:hypothetical protein